MAVKKRTERSAPRVGRGGRYESIYSEEVEVFEVTGHEDTVAALDRVAEASAASHGAANNLRRMSDTCCRYLESQGLPGRFMWIRFDESGAWQYVDEGDASKGDCTGPAALTRLGAYDKHSPTWHAMQVVFRVFHALRALDRGTTETAVECAMGAVQNYERFQIQITRIEQAALSGIRSYGSPGRSKSWIWEHAEEFCELCRSIESETGGRSMPAKDIRIAAGIKLAARHGIDAERVPGDRTLRNV